MVSAVGVPLFPSGALPSANTLPPAAAGADPGAAGSGERAASGASADTAERVEAARQPDRTLKIRDEERRADTPPAADRPPLVTFFANPPEAAGPQLIPPDLSAPTGPPPAFDRSPLDAQRELRLDPATPADAPLSVDDAPTPPPAAPAETELADGGGTSDDTQNTAERAFAQADVPPSADERAQTEFTSVRRMETPYDTATVDVTR